jgi:glycogen synthase
MYRSVLRIVTLLTDSGTVQMKYRATAENRRVVVLTVHKLQWQLLVYEDVRSLSNLPIVTTMVCKDKEGHILSEKKYWKYCNNTLKNY